MLFFWALLVPELPINWSNVNVLWAAWFVDDPVPNKSNPNISSFDDFDCTFDCVGPFLDWPGPIIALFGYAFFYFLVFSLINVFISVALLAGSSLYPGSTNVN